jgi:uncharacterized protein (TIGR02246 family)
MAGSQYTPDWLPERDHPAQYPPLGKPKMTQKAHIADETAIRALVDTWMKASQAGEIDTVLSLMADDVVFMVPGREPFGKEAFRNQAGAMKGMRMEGTNEIREIEVLGGWAYIRNYIQVTMTPPGGEPVRRAGYTLTLLRKEADGRWLLARDANLLTVA